MVIDFSEFRFCHRRCISLSSILLNGKPTTLHCSQTSKWPLILRLVLNSSEMLENVSLEFSSLYRPVLIALSQPTNILTCPRFAYRCLINQTQFADDTLQCLGI